MEGILVLNPKGSDGDVLVKRHDETLMAIFKDAKDAKAREMIQRYSFRISTLDPHIDSRDIKCDLPQLTYPFGFFRWFSKMAIP